MQSQLQPEHCKWGILEILNEKDGKLCMVTIFPFNSLNSMLILFPNWLNCEPSSLFIYLFFSEPGSLDWEADDLPTELALPQGAFNKNVTIDWTTCYKGTSNLFQSTLFLNCYLLIIIYNTYDDRWTRDSLWLTVRAKLNRHILMIKVFHY